MLYRKSGRSYRKECALRRRLAFVLIAGLAVAHASWGQQPTATNYSDSRVFPEGRTGERVRALIDTVNSGAPQSIRDFITTQCAESFRNMAPMDEHITVF